MKPLKGKLGIIDSGEFNSQFIKQGATIMKVAVDSDIKSAVDWFQSQKFILDSLTISKCPKCKDNSIPLKRESDNHCMDCVMKEAFEDVCKKN